MEKKWLNYGLLTIATAGIIGLSSGCTSYYRTNETQRQIEELRQINNQIEQFLDDQHQRDQYYDSLINNTRRNTYNRY